MQYDCISSWRFLSVASGGQVYVGLNQLHAGYCPCEDGKERTDRVRPISRPFLYRNSAFAPAFLEGNMWDAGVEPLPATWLSYRFITGQVHVHKQMATMPRLAVLILGFIVWHKLFWGWFLR
jgi:hypothetical protein